MGVILSGGIHEYKGYSKAEDFRTAIKWPINSRAAKKLGRVFVALDGPKVVESVGKKRCARQPLTLYVGECVLHLKQARSSRSFRELSRGYTRAYGFLSAVVAVRSDGRGVFREGEIGTLCIVNGTSSKNQNLLTAQNLWVRWD